MYEINMAWTSSHGQTTRPCQFGRIKARAPKVIAHGRVTQACPCRAQIESNSEKANFEGFSAF
ncbi:atp-dependent dna helicase ii subunit 1 [Gossypium arboreum]|uniref:Atp-dependent dna helicase ii subunit 1 n=1 Tax=Gossypium arboreum TaxID=29729 RepID=A0A0B0PHS6_GOSAR|nr:atp-dependent dna helicase ii subunit 1 [Gossypium arboreum]KHG23989.1 atp-dependent dna helicase ii subunit 1 [Gossypium arboreum]KHG25902.1 atp-dependent dna helicase ii subunit 1 [Gossypium arboreum]